MTFTEWSEDNEQLIADGTYDLEDIWNIAQQNYPFAICDTQMYKTMIKDVMEHQECTEKQAKKFIGKFGAEIIDDMWTEYNIAIDCYIANNKPIFRAV